MTHTVTIQPADHPNMRAVACNCGYRANAVAAHAQTIADAHANHPTAAADWSRKHGA